MIGPVRLIRGAVNRHRFVKAVSRADVRDAHFETMPTEAEAAVEELRPRTFFGETTWRPADTKVPSPDGLQTFGPWGA